MSTEPLDSEEDDDEGTPLLRVPPEPRSVAEKGPAFAATQPHVQDLSKDIVRAVSRAAGERVTCRRISGNHYRCNWWSPRDTKDDDNPGMTGLTVTTHRVTRSELLRVTKTADRLTIETSPGGDR